MKRADFYKIVTESCKHEKTFEMVYKKVNGEVRRAVCKLHDAEIDKTLKGGGKNRDQKMKDNKVFQYFDVNSNAYRSAKLENILEVKIGNEFEKVED